MSVVVVALLGGCGDDDASPDAGVDAGARDASVRVDGSLLPDAGGDADLPTMDGGGPDAGFACPGICDPVGGRCAAGACVFHLCSPVMMPDRKGTPAAASCFATPRTCFVAKE